MKTSKIKLIGIAILSLAPLAAYAQPPVRDMSEGAAIAYDQRHEPDAGYPAVGQSRLSAPVDTKADRNHAYSVANPEIPQ